MQWLWISLVVVVLFAGKMIWLRDLDIEREKLMKEIRKELQEVRDEILEKIGSLPAQK